MNISLKTFSLSKVTMPLIHVMADADLSWSDREKIAAALRACISQWDSMEKERLTASQQQAAGQQNATNHRPQYGM